jgi:hypothetical protein
MIIEITQPRRKVSTSTFWMLNNTIYIETTVGDPEIYNLVRKQNQLLNMYAEEIKEMF